MDEDALWDILLEAGLTEDQIAEIATLGGLEGEGALAKAQYEQAQSRRQTPWPRGRWTGRVYRSAHPLEHIAAGAERVVGSIQSQRQMEKQRQLLEEQGRRRAALIGAMLKNRQNPPAAPVAPGSMTPVPVGAGNPMTEALRRIDPYQLR